MRQFNISVNGVSYQVSVEEAKTAASIVAATPAPVIAPAPAAKPAAAANAPVAGGSKVTSPMPGTIIDVKCVVGATVKKGDVLVILEAMKMENDIPSPFEGTVKQVAVEKGASVGSGDVLVVIG